MQVSTSFAGNLVEDPTLRYTPSGYAVSNFRVAVNDRVENKTTGEWTDGPTTYLSVTVWRQLAENVAESLHKGDQVVVVGRLTQHEYETDTHEKRTRYDVEADAVGAGLSYATATPVRNRKTTTSAG